ncbi:MAG: BBP7 family outer membrane beta-barrel protein [Planctomycetales bacterium]
MGVRISVAVLAACCVWCAAEARAQSFGDAPPFGPSGGWGDPQFGAFPPGAGGPGIFPAGAYGGGPAAGGYPAAHAFAADTPDSYPGPNGRLGAGPAHPEGCPCPECQQPSILERVWGMDAMLVNAFTPPLTGSRIRAEYLHWRFENPGDRLLGEPLSTVENPQSTFPIFDLFGNQIGTGRVPTLGDINLKDVPGLRLTYVQPLRFGDFELSGLVFNQKSDDGAATFLPNTRPIPNLVLSATSTQLDGQLSNNIQIWDEAFIYSYKVDVWGLDARVVVDTASEDEGFHLKPAYGLRVLHLEEHMKQMGVFTNQGFRPPQVGIVDVKTRNYFYGPMIGGRAEFAHRWFQLGVDPSVTLGLNTYAARVATENFAALGDPKFVTKTNQTDFSPVLELKAWLRIPVSENCSLFGGYTILYAPKTARPASSVVYDVSRANLLEPKSNTHARKNLEEWDAHGFNVGLEFLFP